MEINMTSSYDIKLFSMGGTIDKVMYSYDALNYVVSTPPQATKIIENANLSLKISIESIAAKDSLDLLEADRILLKEKIDKETCSRIIVTHGTDTIPITAKALKDIKNKTIVFTGAMLPAKFIDSDATFNLGGAVVACQTLSPGLYLVMHGRVFEALKVIKDRNKSLFI